MSGVSSDTHIGGGGRRTFAAMDRNNAGEFRAASLQPFGMTDNRLEADTLSGIAKLRQELARIPLYL